MPAADLAEALGQGVEDDGVGIGRVAELVAGHGGDPAVSVTDEDALRLENRHAELALELAEEAEHPVDGAAGGLARLVDGDEKKAVVQDLARRGDRDVVRGPVAEKEVDLFEHARTLGGVERGGDAEKPDSGVVVQSIDVGSWHRIKLLPVSFAKLMQRFKGDVMHDAQPARPQDPMRLATAAVLLDIGYADGTLTPDESDDLVTYLKRAFALSDDDANDLVNAALEIRNRTIDHFAMTNYIRKNATLEQRVEMVRTMWRMVYSDGKLTDYENYLVRKLADLLGLEHHVMIEAKVAVLRELGMAAP